MSKKVRIQFDLPENKVKEIDRLMAISGITTRRELFNNALTLYEWAAKERRSGFQIGSYENVSRDLHILQMPSLNNIEVDPLLQQSAAPNTMAPIERETAPDEQPEQPRQAVGGH